MIDSITQKRDKQAGFTLVEVLIAMFIFSLISIGTFQSMTAAIESHERVKDATARQTEIELARALIKSDLANLILVPTRDLFGTPDLYVLSGGVDNLLAFTRSGRDNPGGLDKRGDLQRLAYKFENGALIRESLLQDNPAPQTEVLRQTLLDGLQDARMEFFERELSYSQIFVQVDNSDAVEFDRIRLTLVFENGDELYQDFELLP